VFFVGVDLGGTNIVTGLINEKGEIIKEDRKYTEANRGAEYVIENMVESINQVVREIGIENTRAIGLGIPGILDIDKGISLLATNLGWENIPVTEKIRQYFPDVPVFIDNDVRVATLGEKYFGAGRDVNNLIMLTIGTGIGAGIIIDGKLYYGSTNSAGEIGHTTIFKDGLYCRCGNRGCLEVYASATGIARRVQNYLKEGHFSAMLDMVNNDVSRITAEIVSKACRRGDPLARMIMEETAELLGISIANYINIINPEMVIIGGGVALASDLLLEPLRKVVKERTLKTASEKVNIVLAKLGDKAGVIGAATLAMVKLGVIK
jgi:glucokinase